MTADADGLIQSDGTAMLHFLDPLTLAERRHVTGTLPRRPKRQTWGLPSAAATCPTAVSGETTASIAATRAHRGPKPA